MSEQGTTRGTTPFLEVLTAFLLMDAWEQAQEIVQAHPELLTDEADAILSALTRQAVPQGDQEAEEARRAVAERRDLLRRCRKVGIAGALAEKMLPAEALAKAAREGVTPEHLLSQLPGRSDAASDATNCPPFPAEFAEDLRHAEEAEECYLRTGELTALDTAAASWERVLNGAKSTAANSQLQSEVLNRAGVVFSLRYRARGRVDDLNSALDCWRRVVAMAESPDLPLFLNNLGSGLRDRFGLTGRPEDLEEAIRAFERAVTGTAEGSPNLPMCLNNLGTGLRDRFGLTGRPEDLEEAIRILEHAVKGTPVGSPILPMYLNNLGTALHVRFGRTGRSDDLEEIIRVFERAVTGTTAGSPNLPMYLNNLGTAIHVRFERTGRRQDLEDVIRILQGAVSVTPAESPSLPMYLNNLGNGLLARFKRTRHLQDLEAAICAFERAVAGTSPESPNLPMYLNNLGSGLRASSGRAGRRADLDEAIRAFERAVLATPAESPSLPMYLSNLGNGLRARFERTGHPQDLEAAIRAFERAVAGTPSESPNLPTYLNSLGTGLGDRFGQTGRPQDLEEAIQCYRRSCELGALSAPQVVLAAAVNWGRSALQRKQWAETAEAYGHGLATGRQVLGRQLLRLQKEDALRDLQEMSGPAAYALAKLVRLEDAVTTAERGRARLLAEALQRNRRDLDQLPAVGHSDLYRRYRDIVDTQELLTQPAAARPDQTDYLSGHAPLEAIVAANAAFDQVVSEIQKVPGYADFLAESTFSQIQAVAQDSPLVYLLATSSGGLALIVYADNAQPIWLAELTDATLLEWLNGATNAPTPGGWLGAYQNWLAKGTKQAQHAWFALVDDLTSWLWSQIMGPVALALRKVLPIDPSSPRTVTLIPAGLLALLPLHAAWTKDPSSTPGLRRYFLDEFAVRYAPSALALRYALDAAERVPVERLLAVEEPLAAKATRLPNAHAEVVAIASLFHDPVVLARAEATRQAVREALPHAQVVHFSCHGYNCWHAPLDSGLLMGNNEAGEDVLLTVRDLLDTELAGGRLATLAACETGIVGAQLPDEVVMLPSALLQAGFGGVVASLWAVGDLSTAVLMERFYRLWRKDKLQLAQALRAAQCWVRDSTNGEMAEYFKCYSPALSAALMSEAPASNVFTQANSRDLDRRDFQHPYWWAAFYLTGV